MQEPAWPGYSLRLALALRMPPTEAARLPRRTTPRSTGVHVPEPPASEKASWAARAVPDGAEVSVGGGARDDGGVVVGGAVTTIASVDGGAVAADFAVVVGAARVAVWRTEATVVGAVGGGTVEAVAGGAVAASTAGIEGGAAASVVVVVVVEVVVVVGGGSRTVNTARAGVPGAGVPSALVCVAITLWSPGVALGTVNVKEIAPVASGRPDHSTGPVLESHCTTTGSALGAPPFEFENPLPVAFTWAPGGAALGPNVIDANGAQAKAALTYVSTAAAAAIATPMPARRRPLSMRGHPFRNSRVEHETADG